MQVACLQYIDGYRGEGRPPWGQPGMKILLIDTCGAAGSIALADTSLEPASFVASQLARPHRL